MEEFWGVKGEKKDLSEAIRGVLKMKELENCTVPKPVVVSPHFVFVIFTSGTKKHPHSREPQTPQKNFSHEQEVVSVHIHFFLTLQKTLQMPKQ